MLHQIGKLRVRIIQNADASVNDLGKIVRGNICCHADGNAGGAVDKQVWKAARKHTRLFARFVEVGIPVDGILFEITQHFIGDL